MLSLGKGLVTAFCASLALAAGCAKTGKLAVTDPFAVRLWRLSDEQVRAELDRCRGDRDKIESAWRDMVRAGSDGSIRSPEWRSSREAAIEDILTLRAKNSFLTLCMYAPRDVLVQAEEGDLRTCSWRVRIPRGTTVSEAIAAFNAAASNRNPHTTICSDCPREMLRQKLPETVQLYGPSLVEALNFVLLRVGLESALVDNAVTVIARNRIMQDKGASPGEGAGAQHSYPTDDPFPSADE